MGTTIETSGGVVLESRMGGLGWWSMDLVLLPGKGPPNRCPPCSLPLRLYFLVTYLVFQLRRPVGPLDAPACVVPALDARPCGVARGVSPALELDEAEQALWSQTLAWGYGGQPPLYTWLQAGWFALLGPGVLALSSLKFMLLGLTLVLVWRTALP